MMKTKVCVSPGCKKKGKRQNVSEFKELPKNKSGFSNHSSKCLSCVYRENNEAVHGTAVKRVSNNEWMIENVLYKLWNNGYVFIHNGYEYIRSSRDQKWLERTVRNG